MKQEDIEALKSNPHSKIVFPEKGDISLLNVMFSVPIVNGDFVYEALKDTLKWNGLSVKENVSFFYALLAEYKGGLNG